MKTSTTRFSDRVEDYIKYRPHYPQQIIEILKANINLDTQSIIADIGSGTGISSALFLNNDNKVFAVEPNREMREAAELIYLNESNFISIDGKAQQTTLQQHSVDIIFCAQAFHWFNTTETKIESARVLQPKGHIVFVWNIRKDENDFQKEYEAILKKIPEYNKVTHKNILDDDIINFFTPKNMNKKTVSNLQVFDLAGLKGRLQSSSYCPKEGKAYQSLMNEIEKLFHKFENDGFVQFEYDTNIYWS